MKKRIVLLLINIYIFDAIVCRSRAGNGFREKNETYTIHLHTDKDSDKKLNYYCLLQFRHDGNSCYVNIS